MIQRSKRTFKKLLREEGKKSKEMDLLNLEYSFVVSH